MLGNILRGEGLWSGWVIVCAVRGGGTVEWVGDCVCSEGVEGLWSGWVIM